MVRAHIMCICMYVVMTCIVGLIRIRTERVNEENSRTS